MGQDLFLRSYSTGISCLCFICTSVSELTTYQLGLEGQGQDMTDMSMEGVCHYCVVRLSFCDLERKRKCSFPLKGNYFCKYWNRWKIALTGEEGHDKCIDKKLPDEHFHAW